MPLSINTMTTILCSVVSLIFTNLEDGDELDHVVDDGDAVVAEHVAVAVPLLELHHGLPVHLAEAGQGLHTELQGSPHQGRGDGLGDEEVVLDHPDQIPRCMIIDPDEELQNLLMRTGVEV